MSIAVHLARTDRKAFRELRRDQQKHVRSFPATLTAVPYEQWPAPPRAIRVWRSREFLVQLYDDAGQLRLSVNRCAIGNDGHWVDGITWDELMRVKTAVGYGGAWAVEVFPPDQQTVNVANIRHLWIIPAPAFAWISESCGKEPSHV